MPFKLINCLILLATVAASTGCQSIPNTTDNAGVINNVVAYDMQLSSNTVDDIQRLEIKLQEKSSLTETEAVLYALNNNAAFKALLIDLKLAKADLVNAGLLPNPELLFAFGVSNKPYRYAIDLPIEALWLRPIRLRTMKHEADAVANRLTQSGLNLIKDVRIAYAQAVLAQEQFSVTETSYKLRNNIYTLSLKRLEAGDINGKDILLAQNDAAIAKRDWELAEYDVKVKMQSLLYALGVGQKYNAITLAPNLIPACNVDEVDYLLTQSLGQRPDILSAQHSINASKEKIKLSKLGWLKLTATADATSGLVNGHTLGPAIRSTIPIANQNQGAVSRAEAELEKAELSLEALKQQAVLEIKTAHLQYQQSCHDWHVLQDTLKPTVLQMIQLTENAYQKGDIAYLQTLEANRQFVDTQMREVQLKADLIAKYAELMRNSSKKVDAKK
ncbi:MAG: TolC family protein [Methylotenera sp.]|nr:TolC family protein [Methylotenera sp.]